MNWLRPYVVEMSAQYGQIKVPVEIVHGDADTIVPLAVHSAKVPGQIAGANVTVLPGIGHMPQHTNPDDVIAAIDRVAARGAGKSIAVPPRVFAAAVPAWLIVAPCGLTLDEAEAEAARAALPERVPTVGGVADPEAYAPYRLGPGRGAIEQASDIFGSGDQ